MILLDTNVVSELMRSSPDPAVEAWGASQPIEQLYFSTVGEAELRYCAAIMTTGQSRDKLVTAIESMLETAFEGRILPLDSKAARAYAEVVSARRAAGRPISITVCQIAAIARSRGMSVATRNVRDFADMGVDLIDPWAG